MEKLPAVLRPTLTGWKPDPSMYVVPRFSACGANPTAPLTHLLLLFLLAYSWISPGCSLEGLMLRLKRQYFGHLMRRVDSLEKTDAGRDWGQEEKGTTEDEMAGWHHRPDGHESE